MTPLITAVQLPIAEGRHACCALLHDFDAGAAGAVPDAYGDGDAPRGRVTTAEQTEQSSQLSLAVALIELLPRTAIGGPIAR